MFDKILVTLDGSELAEGVLPYIRGLAPKFNSELIIFGVFLAPEKGLSRLFEAYLKKIAGSFQEQKIKAMAVLSHGNLYGNPANEILEYAEKNKIDLIAMTTSGRSGVTRWLLGSTAEKIVQEATTPVLMVRGRQHAEAKDSAKAIFSNILVPLDGSEVGETALLCVEALAKNLNSLVTLMHLNPPLYKAVGNLEYAGPFPEEIVEQLRTAGTAYLDGVRKRLVTKGLSVSSEVATGDPAEKILEYTKEKQINLIAMSTHGRGGIARWALGSVADKVVHGSEIPVWIVRARPAAKSK